jgi:thymidylate kinase
MLSSDDTGQTLQTANEIYALAAKWRRAPDVTFLIEDDLDTAIKRAQDRLGRPFTEDESLILRRASNLYSEYAGFHKDRIIRLDRRTMTEHQILLKMRQSLLQDS